MLLCTGNPRTVTGVNDYGTIEEESDIVGIEREEQIDYIQLKWISRNLSVFPS